MKQKDAFEKNAIWALHYCKKADEILGDGAKLHVPLMQSTYTHYLNVLMQEFRQRIQQHYSI